MITPSGNSLNLTYCKDRRQALKSEPRPHKAAPADARSRGIGGQLDYHTEPANLHFLDGQTIITWHCENLRICADIADPTLARLTESIPSLLGRNFLNLCLTLADPLHNQFSLEPYQTTAQGPGSAVIS